jgi:hypothetical protein
MQTGVPAIVGRRFQVDKASPNKVRALDRRGLGNLANQAMVPPLVPCDMRETASARRSEIGVVNKQPFTVNRRRAGGDSPLSDYADHTSGGVWVKNRLSVRR